MAELWPVAGLSSLKNEVLARVDCVELPSSCCALTQLTRWHDDAAELYKTGVQTSNRLLLLRGCESSGFSRSDELVVNPTHLDRFSASLSKASGSGKPTTIHQPSTIKTPLQFVANWDELQCSSGPSGTIGTSGAGQKYRKQYNRVQAVLRWKLSGRWQSAQMSEKCF